MSKPASTEIEKKANTRMAQRRISPLRLNQSLVITGAGVLLLTGLMLLGEKLREWPNLAVFSAWLFIWIFISDYFFRLRRLRREHFRENAVRKSSWIYNFFGAGILTWIFSGILSIPLATGLLINLGAGIDHAIWLGLLALLPFWVFARHLTRRYFRRHLQPPFHILKSERATFWGASLVTISLLVVLLLFIPQPDYSGVPFSELLSNGSQAIEANSSILMTLIGVESTLQSSIEWTMQTVVSIAPSASVAWSTTITLLIMQSLWIAPLLLLLHASSNIVENLWRAQPAETAQGTLGRVLLLGILSAIAIAPLLEQSLKRDWLDPVHTLKIGDRNWEIRESQLKEIPPVEGWATGARKNEAKKTIASIDREIDSLFESVHARVPTYLDWHYSFDGRKNRMLAGLSGWILDDYGMSAGEMLSETLFPEKFQEESLEELEQRVNEIYRKQLQSLATTYQIATTNQLDSVDTQGASTSGDELNSTDLAPTLESNVSDILSSKRAIGSVAMAATVGALTPKALGIASKRMASGAIDEAEKKHAKSRAVRKTGRVAGRLAPCGAVVAGSAVTGVGAVVAGGACFVTVTSVGIWADSAIEEELERETMATLLHAAIDNQKKIMKDKYRSTLRTRFEADAKQLESTVTAWLRPWDALTKMD